MGQEFGVVLTPVSVKPLPWASATGRPPRGWRMACGLARDYGLEAPLAGHVGLFLRQMQHPHDLASGFPRAPNPKESKAGAAVSLMT